MAEDHLVRLSHSGKERDRAHFRYVEDVERRLRGKLGEGKVVLDPGRNGHHGASTTTNNLSPDELLHSRLIVVFVANEIYASPCDESEIEDDLVLSPFRIAQNGILPVVFGEDHPPKEWKSNGYFEVSRHSPKKLAKVIATLYKRNGNSPSFDGTGARSREADVAALTGKYKPAISLYPNEKLHADELFNRGIARACAHDYEGAIEDFDELVESEPDSGTGSAYNCRAVAKARLGRHEDAADDFTEAIRQNPDSALPFLNLGIVRTAQTRYEEAIDCLGKAIKLDSSHPTAYYYRGLAKSQLGEYEDAIYDYSRVIYLDPEHVSAYAGRGSSKRKLGWHNDAAGDYAEALGLLNRDMEILIDEYSKDAPRRSDEGSHVQHVLPLG